VTLQLYLLRQLAMATLFAAGALAFVVFPAIAVTAVHKLGGVGVGAVATYIPLVAIGLLPYLLSLGFLLAVVSTYGRMAADNEWLALSMAGIHPLRTLVPGIVVGLLLGGGTYVLLAEVSPRWRLEQNNFRHGALLEAFRSLAPGRTEIDLPGFYIGAAGRDGAAFVDAQVRIPGESGQDLVIVAERVEPIFDARRLVLAFDGMRTVKGNDLLYVDGLGYSVPIDEMVTRSAKDPMKPSHRSSSAMLADLRAGTALERWRDLYHFEIHERYALSAIYVLFLLIGVPTGLWLRSGTQLVGLGVAAIYAFTYYILSMRLGRELVDGGVVPPAVAAWSTNVLGLAIGLIALYRVVRR